MRLVLVLLLFGGCEQWCHDGPVYDDEGRVTGTTPYCDPMNEVQQPEGGE